MTAPEATGEPPLRATRPRAAPMRVPLRRRARAALRVAACVAVAALFVGSITTTHESALQMQPRSVEAPMGALASGSSGGVNGTNGTASVAGALVSATTDVLYLNNTNATTPAYAKLVLTGSSGLAGVSSLAIGIKNGTTSVSQVTASAGSITQSEGAYVRLEPGSANRIYMTQTVGFLFGGTSLRMDLLVADDLAESATIRTKVALNITS